MEVIRANADDADIIGYIHSVAWKQAYVGMFPEDFLNGDTPEKRKQEFIDSCGCEDVSYYIMYENDKAVGIVKVVDAPDAYEIASLYILEQYRNQGYGKRVIAYLKKEFDKKRIQLWVLEDNPKAKRFYENNGFKNTGNSRVIYRGNSYVQIQYERLPEV